MSQALVFQFAIYISSTCFKVCSPSMANKDQLTSFVKDYTIKSAQIECLSKSPTSIQTRVDPNFASTLEAQRNPSLAYNHAMKQLYLEQLGAGLREKQRQEQERARGDYRARVDGVLCELERNSLTHSLLLQRKMNQQEERGLKFVDQSRIKGDRIERFISAHQDKDVFNHQSDLYQQHQRNELAHSLSLLSLQKDLKAQQDQRQRQQKQREQQQRMQYERMLDNQRRQERENRIESQLRYQSELQGMVEEKKEREARGRDRGGPLPLRHNPITNPIQYHIDNPYLLKKMADRQHF